MKYNVNRSVSLEISHIFVISGFIVFFNQINCQISHFDNVEKSYSCTQKMIFIHFHSNPHRKISLFLFIKYFQNLQIPNSICALIRDLSKHTIVEVSRQVLLDYFSAISQLLTVRNRHSQRKTQRFECRLLYNSS